MGNAHQGYEMSKLVKLPCEPDTAPWLRLQVPLPLERGYGSIPTNIPILLWHISSKNRGWVGYTTKPPLAEVEKNFDGSLAFLTPDKEWLRYGPVLSIYKTKLSTLRRCCGLTELPKPLHE